MSNDKNRMIIFFLLTVGFMILWQVFYVAPKVEEQQRLAEVQRADDIKNGKITLDTVLNSKIDNTQKNPQIIDSVEEQIPAPRIKIYTDKLHGSFSLRGSRFDDITLAEFKQTMEDGSPDEVLLSYADKEKSYFTELGFLASAGVDIPDANTLWKADNEILSVDTPVTLTWKNPQGIVFKRVIGIDKNYLFTIDESIENNTPSNIKVTPYGRINRAHEDARSRYISHEGPLAVIDEVLEELPYGELQDDGKQEFNRGKGWIAIGDKYWLTALLPAPNEDIKITSAFINNNGTKRYQIDYVGSEIVIPAGETADLKRHIFIGAKKVRLLDEYGEKLQIPLLDRAIDYGVLYFLTKPMINALLMFYHMLGNFGLAILMLTVCVKLLLFPLASKSYRSFARMRVVSPELTAIKKRCKDDKARLNKEMMDLYKTHHINPAAGCLPMLLQIPVFFSLYKVLYISIEMRHAEFYGWIHDLSAPDPTNLFNIFGLLPYDVYTWLPAIGAWPIVYAVSMFVQQGMNPAPADPTQAMMMKFLPLIFLFIFAGFPAGLVIYWVWNNVLSVAQQYYITKRINADPKFKTN